MDGLSATILAPPEGKMRRFVAVCMIAMFLFVPLQAAAAQEPQPSVTVQPAAPAPLVTSETSLSALFNTNLVPDGNAEAPYATYWNDNEGYTQILQYGASCGGICAFPSPYDPGPAQRGTSFFYMGNTSNHTNGTNMWIKNEISLASIQAAVNTGKLRYILSGYFGGEWNNDTSAQLHMFFETSSHSSTGDAVVGNVNAADRGNKTGLLYREKTGTIPKGTQWINLDLQTGYFAPGSNLRNGYADNLSLVLLPLQANLPLIQTGASQAPAKTGFPAPTGVLVTPNGLTRMNIIWTDNSSGELGFEVQRINANSSVDTICNTKPNVTSCLDPGISQSATYGYVYLGSGKTYTYQVRAVGPVVNSAWASGTGTTAVEPINPPSPTGGVFTCQSLDVTSSSATFVWNDPFNYEAGFNIYVGSNTYASWTMMEKGTKISFINQNPGTIQLTIKPFVYDRANSTYVYESTTSCTATATLPSPPVNGTGVTYFSNDASYPVISLIVDGWEQFPVRPLGILSGAYYELDGVPAGTHSWTALTGFWDDWGQRFTMYQYTGSYSQPSSGPFNIHIPDMSIKDLLSVPPTNLGYWEGYYFDANANCFTTAFKFTQSGTFTFYNANTQIDSGTYSLVKREPAIFSTKFHVSSSKQNYDGLLIETHGQFYLSNGPASWPQITYVFKPQGYVRNPFCP
jgi:hypothetical protein